jgi:hypothetical protein
MPWHPVAKPEIAEGMLIWHGWSGEPIEFSGKDGSILERFVRLAGIPEERFGDAVAAFAATFGVLGLCRHLMPHTHFGQRAWLALAALDDNFGDVRPCQSGAWRPGRRERFWCEPLERWRAYARQAAAMLRLSRLLRIRRVGAAEWEPLLELLPPGIRPDNADVVPLLDLIGYTEEQIKQIVRDHVADYKAPLLPHAPGWVKYGERRISQEREKKRNTLVSTGVRDQRRSFAWCVQAWLQMGDVNENFIWTDPARPTFEISPETMFGTLAYHLARKCTGATSAARCHNCHQMLTGRARSWCSREECKKVENAAKGLRYRDGNRVSERLRVAKYRAQRAK